MHLDDKLNNLQFSTHLDVVKDILQEAKPSFTFWGGRVITHNDYEGSAAVNDVAQQAIDASRYLTGKQEQLSVKQRLNGIAIERKLDLLYLKGDSKLNEMNWFTQLLVFIREFTFEIGDYSFNKYTPRLAIEEYPNRRFNHFGNIENYQKHFGLYAGTLTATEWQLRELAE